MIETMLEAKDQISTKVVKELNQKNFIHSVHPTCIYRIHR